MTAYLLLYTHTQTLRWLLTFYLGLVQGQTPKKAKGRRTADVRGTLYSTEIVGLALEKG